jgi:hypothetical protein
VSRASGLAECATPTIRILGHSEGHQLPYISQVQYFEMVLCALQLGACEHTSATKRGESMSEFSRRLEAILNLSKYHREHEKFRL